MENIFYLMELHNFMPEMDGFNLYDNLIDLTELKILPKEKAASPICKDAELKLMPLLIDVGFETECPHRKYNDKQEQYKENDSGTMEDISDSHKRSNNSSYKITSDTK